MMPHLRHNYIVNILDGAFFGFALGFASFVTIIPLFISRFTDSAVLIGLVPVLHTAGMQLPQLFIADLVSKQVQHKKLVLFFTIHERLPFLVMAGIAWFSPGLNPKWVLIMTFLMLAWQGFGGGFTANSWQNMVAKLIPANQRGTFLGLQGSALNGLFSVGAIIAGVILVRLDSPQDFTLCFLIASGLLVISFVSLSLTRESPSPPLLVHTHWKAFLENLTSILRRDRNFNWFLAGRLMTQFASMASAFYIVYALRHFQMDEVTAGLMTGVLAISQIVANPLLGWLGDRLGHRLMLAMGGFAAGLSALVALVAPSLSWFYLVFILAGIGNVASWTIAMSITMQFSSEAERPAYFGLANTLIAPTALAAPLLGGWMADQTGYQSTFATAAAFGLVTTLIFVLLLRDPQHIQGKDVSSQPAAALED